LTGHPCLTPRPPLPPDGPQRVTLPTLQILAAFMADLSRDDWYGRAFSVDSGLVLGAVLECLYLYRLEKWGLPRVALEGSRSGHRDGRPTRRFYQLTEHPRTASASAARGVVQPWILIERGQLDAAEAVVDAKVYGQAIPHDVGGHRGVQHQAGLQPRIVATGLGGDHGPK
jgi:hypothetical protein